MDLYFTFSVLGIAIALAVDAFTVACGVGLMLGDPSRRQSFRLSWHFGLFQFLMPLIGWGIGSGVAGVLTHYGKWLAFAVLAALGAKMILGAVRNRSLSFASDPTRGVSLIILSIAVSIDALGVGFSLSLIEVGVLWPSIVIGVVASLFTLLGLHLGRIISKRFEKTAMIIGGLVLVAIGIKFLF